MNNYNKCTGSLITDWTEVPLKYILEANSMKVGPFGSQLSGTDFKDEGYWVYNQRTVVDENFDENTVFVDEAKYSSMSAFQVNPGDILITTRGTIGRIARVPNNYYSGIIHPCIIKFKLLEHKLLFSLFKHIFNDSDIVTDQLKFMSNATTIDVVYSGTLKKVSIPIPPLSEQKRIADFLDGKCAEIDGLVADIQLQIDTLEQYKRSVITETVTKGLNPDAEMKDSGIQWIGIIPKHWQIDKLRYHLARNEPKNPGNQMVLSLYRELGVIPKDSRDDNHNVTSEDTSKYKYVRCGDFVVNKMKAWQGSVAVSDYEGIVSPAYYVYRFTDGAFNKRYFHFLLRSCYKDEFMRLSGGIRVGQWDLPSEALDNIPVLIPPLTEQKLIADYLDAKVTEIDGIIDQKKEQLSILENYKKSLIYEYVTGKKEVPV